VLRILVALQRQVVAPGLLVDSSKEVAVVESGYEKIRVNQTLLGGKINQY